MNNFVLIGMPATGKSTISNLFSNEFDIIDVDLLLSQKFNITLQEFINKFGESEFLFEENKILLSLPINNNTIISTGGSAVYCSEAMNYLKSNNFVFIYLKTSLPSILERLDSSKNRGIIMNGSNSIEELYYQRESLYLKYSDILIETDNKSPEDIYYHIHSFMPFNKC